MREIKVRKLREATVLALDEEAARKGISREELVRSILNQWAVNPDISAVHDKYSDLVSKVASISDNISHAIESLKSKN